VKIKAVKSLHVMVIRRAWPSPQHQQPSLAPHHHMSAAAAAAEAASPIRDADPRRGAASVVQGFVSGSQRPARQRRRNTI